MIDNEVGSYNHVLFFSLNIEDTDQRMNYYFTYTFFVGFLLIK